VAVLSVCPCTMITTSNEQKVKEIFEVWKVKKKILWCCENTRKKTMTSIMITIIVSIMSLLQRIKNKNKLSNYDDRDFFFNYFNYY